MGVGVAGNGAGKCGENVETEEAEQENVDMVDEFGGRERWGGCGCGLCCSSGGGTASGRRRRGRRRGRLSHCEKSERVDGISRRVDGIRIPVLMLMEKRKKEKRGNEEKRGKKEAALGGYVCRDGEGLICPGNKAAMEGQQRRSRCNLWRQRQD